VAVLADAAPAMLREAALLAPRARCVADLDALLAEDLDGLVIATPSALHAEQSIRALERGLAVFCQKPLGRDAAEVAAVLEAARRADRLLAVDLSYRFTDAMQRIRALAQSGALGRIHAVDLVFHNAYGPDKPWFCDPAQSGGGCVIDLGVHLVDLALWVLDFPAVPQVSGLLRRRPRTGAAPGRGGGLRGRHAADCRRSDPAPGLLLAVACRPRRGDLRRLPWHGGRCGAAQHRWLLLRFPGRTFPRHAMRDPGAAARCLGGPRRSGLGAAAGRRGALRPGRQELLAVARVLDRIYGRDTTG
jgi:hypothetical protein